MAYDATEFNTTQVFIDHCVRENLIKARALILEKGWGQGRASWTDANGEESNYCMLGAIGTCSQNHDIIDASIQHIGRHLPNHNPLRNTYYGSIVGYNDASGRTKEEIIAVFDKAIAS